MAGDQLAMDLYELLREPARGPRCDYLDEQISNVLNKVGYLSNRLVFKVEDLILKPVTNCDSYRLTVHVRFKTLENLLAPSLLPLENISAPLPHNYNSSNMLTLNLDISNIAMMEAKHRPIILEYAIKDLAESAANELLKVCGTSLKEEYKSYHEKLHKQMCMPDWSGTDAKRFAEEWVPSQPSAAKYKYKKWQHRANLKEQRKKNAPWGYE